MKERKREEVHFNVTTRRYISGSCHLTRRLEKLKSDMNYESLISRDVEGNGWLGEADENPSSGQMSSRPSVQSPGTSRTKQLLLFP